MEAQLAEAAALESGKTADFRAVDAAVERIRKRLARRGYLKSEVEVVRNIHDAERTVDLTIQVRVGPQFTFGKLSVEGLDLDGEAEIRRLWALKAGAPFDAEYPEFFLRRVREDGIFDNLGKTRYEVQVHEAELRVDVTLYFR
jgi:outer membrane protein assembly factor BamA